MIPGSSPRVRGKRRSRAGQDTLGGLIPARAGKTSPRGPRWSGTRAHPRACGENAMSVSSKPAIPGSSPRVRGKLRVDQEDQRWQGLIPACAGKTRCTCRPAPARRAHPRVCGENVGGRGGIHLAHGSSPRVRGKRPDGATTSRPPRLIPACAGKTSPCARLSSIVTAHPRVCGENLDLADPESFPLGSSPRVRGKPSAAAQASMVPGLIPARAGKTPLRHHRPHQRWAHPRACGENWSTRASCARIAGSSPRVRGKLHQVAPPLARVRLIPARAGKTGGGRARCTASRAHPRACGENRDVWRRL